uniref:Uncharacterized protein n=1 Tax=Zea mays TaxID=4577 RepID=A0A804NU46_MAIZE
MATAREQTPPPTPRHLAELRIDSAHCVVAFSTHCAADAQEEAPLHRPSLLRMQEEV